MEELMVCDGCGADQDIQCEIFMAGADVDRIYHLCPNCLVKVYRDSLEVFLEHSEYKVNTYLRNAIDGLIVEQFTHKKLQAKAEGEVGDDVEVNLITAFSPDYVRKVSPYNEKDSGDE